MKRIRAAAHFTVMFRMTLMNTKLILKILAVLFLIKAVSNYNLLLLMTKIEFVFWLQYVSAAGIVCYFLVSFLNIYGSFSDKKWIFITFYFFIIFSSLLTSPALPIPYSFIQSGIFQTSFIWSLNFILLIFVVFLHFKSNKT